MKKKKKTIQKMRRKWNLVRSGGIKVARPEVEDEQRGIEEVISDMKIQFQLQFRRCRLRIWYSSEVF